jgi:hypothetical protein
MPSTYSTRLRFEDIGNGEQSGTWGDTTDRNIGTLVEEAIAGVAQVTMTDANYTLTALNGTSDEARNLVLEISGALTASRNVICPTAEKVYFVKNATTGGQSIVLKTSGGTGITIPNGRLRVVYCDGTNVVDAITDLASGTQMNGVDVVTTTGTQSLTNKTISVADGSFSVIGSSDSSKIMKFEVDGFTTATTRTVTVPNATFTMVGDTVTQSLTNKTIDITDGLLTILGSSDATKKVNFEVDGLTTSTTRVLTVPDANTTIGSSPTRNAQTGVAYPIVSDDRGKHITLSNVSAITVTIPQATGAFGNGWYTTVENISTGIATITPTTSTINGGASIKLGQGEAVRITSDGTNYRALGQGAAYTNITGLVEDTAPDYVNDYVATAELSSLTAKKVKLSNLAPSGALASKTGSYTATTSDRGKSIRFAGLAADATLTLPAAATAGDGFILYVSNEDTTDVAPFGVIVDPNSTELIDGFSTRKMYLGSRVAILCDGTGWRTVSGHWRYFSGDQTIPAANALLSLSHGLGIRPRNVWGELRCTTAENGYSIGDTLFIQWDYTSAGWATAAMYTDATTINYRMGDGSPPYIMPNKSTGGHVGITITNWKIRFYAED